MKKFLTLILILICFAVPAFGETKILIEGLENLTFEELVQAREQIDLAIWSCKEWQEVEVPQGVWKVGRDIPVGKWTVRPAGDYLMINAGNVLDDSGHSVAMFKSDFSFYEYLTNPKARGYDAASSQSSCEIEFPEGTFIIIELGSAIFTPYTGKPALGFK